MRELLDSILRVFHLAGPLNTVLFILGLVIVIAVPAGIFKKGTETDSSVAE